MLKRDLSADKMLSNIRSWNTWLGKLANSVIQEQPAYPGTSKCVIREHSGWFEKTSFQSLEVV